MLQHLLQPAYVNSVPNAVNGKRMPERVRMYVPIYFWCSWLIFSNVVRGAYSNLRLSFRLTDNSARLTVVSRSTRDCVFLGWRGGIASVARDTAIEPQAGTRHR